MPPLLSKLTSFFPPVITDREKANNARNLARINMRSDERVEDSIERRLACLKDLNDKKLELKNRRLREARKRKHDGIDIVAPAPPSITDEVIAIEILSSEDDVPNKKKLGLRGLQSGLITRLGLLRNLLVGSLSREMKLISNFMGQSLKETI